MKIPRYIIKKSLFIEIRINQNASEVKLWTVTLGKKAPELQPVAFKMGDSLEKWKHSLAIVSITGEQVASKLYRQEDASIKKITENKELLWSITSAEENEEPILSFLRKELVDEWMEQLAKNNIHILEKQIGRRNEPEREKLIRRFYEKEMTLSSVYKTTGWLNAVCDVFYHRIQLPVLLLFFFLLLGNFMLNNKLRKEYDSLQSELYMKQRNQKISKDNQSKWGRLQAEYQKIPDCSFALISDRIASYVPTNVRLNLLSVFPLESTGGSLLNRKKELQLKPGVIVVKGEVEIPGSVTLFSQFLSSDALFSKVEIRSLSRQKNTSMFSFELQLTL